MGDTIQILIAMVIYMAIVIIIGVAFAKRANKNSEEYFLGGRSLGPWVTAMSAEASDMSGWLLMGLPGVAYWCGIADAAWTAIGLALGTYINWLIVSKRLRRYSEKAGNAITLPEYFSNRFHEKKKVVMTIAAIFILIFFTVYAASCLVTCGKLFSTLFDMPYIPMMIVGAVFVLIYTILGGFLAESASDFMQAIVMIIALGVVVTVGTVAAGGLGAVIENAKSIPGFFDFFGIATPTTVDGVQQVVNGQPQFGAAGNYSILSIISNVAWGLGYFGMPQVLLRFMAIRDEHSRDRTFPSYRYSLGGYLSDHRCVHRRHGSCSLPFRAADSIRCGERIHPALHRAFTGTAGWFCYGGYPGGHHQLFRLLSADCGFCLR